jgi:hypothetical protein
MKLGYLEMKKCIARESHVNVTTKRGLFLSVTHNEGGAMPCKHTVLLPALVRIAWSSDVELRERQRARRGKSDYAGQKGCPAKY